MCTWAAFQEVLVFTLHSFVHFSSLCHLANWSLEYSSPSCVFFVPFPHEMTRDQLLLLLLLITLSGSEPINHVSSNAANEMELEEWHSHIINWIKSPQSMNKRKCYKKRDNYECRGDHEDRYFGILSDMHWIRPFSVLVKYAFLINCALIGDIKTFHGHDLYVFPLITPPLSHHHRQSSTHSSIHSSIDHYSGGTRYDIIAEKVMSSTYELMWTSYPVI